jgi:hypothetical protein
MSRPFTGLSPRIAALSCTAPYVSAGCDKRWDDEIVRQSRRWGQRLARARIWLLADTRGLSRQYLEIDGFRERTVDFIWSIAIVKAGRKGIPVRRLKMHPLRRRLKVGHRLRSRWCCRADAGGRALQRKRASGWKVVSLRHDNAASRVLSGTGRTAGSPGRGLRRKRRLGRPCIG